MLKMQRKR